MLNFEQFKAMREEIRSFIASRTWVSYEGLVVAAMNAYPGCTRDQAEYAIKDLPRP